MDLSIVATIGFTAAAALGIVVLVLGSTKKR
jgi:hypothetical protein